MAPEYPIAPFTGQGLGLSHSSFDKIGSLLPFRHFGQAELACHINLANGNLVLKDHALKIVEVGDILELGWVYNSLSSTQPLSWRLGVVGEFSKLPDPIFPIPTITRIEADGHVTPYIYNEEQKRYVATEYSNGQPYLFYNGNLKQWMLYHPKSGMTENYSQDGLLASKTDREGRTTQFEYDAKKQLTAVVGVSGCRYEIEHSATEVNFYTNQNGIKTLLQKHTFQNSLLISTETSDEQYSIRYEYYEGTNRLRSVKQSDGTFLGFNYDSNLTKRVSQIRVGDRSSNIDYQPSSGTFKDGFGSETILEFDSSAQIIKLTQQRGYNQYQDPPDVTSYSYYPTKQLESIIRPDGGIEHNTYDTEHYCSLLMEHSLQDGQLTQYSYKADTSGRPKLATLIKKLNQDTVATTRYVYDDNYDNKGNSFLRFSISPEGRVTEYRPDSKTKNPATIRTYIDVLFTDPLPNDKAPSLNRMLEWVKNIDPQQVTLNEYRYNERGQAQIAQKYGHIDAQGNGINDDAMSKTTTSWDIFGGWDIREDLQSKTVETVTRQEYDSSLHRLVKKADLVSKENHQLRYRETLFQYQDLDTQCNVKVTLPNGQEQLQQLDKQGLVISESDSAVINTKTQVRTTTFQRDTGGRVVETIGPDGNMLVTFYDRQQRLGFTVSPLGHVEEYQYDRVNRFKTTIRYSNSIDVNKLILNKKYLPSASTLIKLLKEGKNPEQDRYSYEFYDYTDRVRYQVDEENYVTEFIYDKLDRKIGQIIYKNPLDNEQLNLLKLGKPFQLQPNSKIDRWWQYFYDKDGNLIVEQDPAGYVTQNKYDASNRCYEKIHYATPTPHASNLHEVIPAEDKNKDAHSFYYYNARNKIILEVDAENYVTSHTYYNSGLKKKTTRYNNPLNENWYENNDNNNFIPLIPPVSSEDQTTHYEYDLVNRPAKITSPFNNISETSYDDLDSVLLTKTYDGAVSKFNDDTLRVHSKWYDQFEQLCRESDFEDVNQTPYEHFYDESGLKIKTINPLGHCIYYFYDLDRRPIVAINARGAIVETTLNNFNESIQVRKYEQRISPTDLLLLTGGFISPEFRKKLNDLQNDKDAITQNMRNKRGLIVKIIDPEDYVTEWSHTAFKQVEEELLPLTKTTYYKIKREYEIRGLEVKTAKLSSEEKLISSDQYEYDNLQGKKTMHCDALGNETHFINDRLGRVVQVIDPEDIERETRKLDAFDRVTTTTDSLGKTITNVFDQTTRSRKIIYPKGNSEIFTQNAFGENISHEDGVKNKETWCHESAGNITQHAQEVTSEAKKYLIEDGYNLLHLQNSHIDANKNETQFIHNSVGSIEQVILDPINARLSTTLELDAWERTRLEIDPRLNHTLNTHDKRDLLTKRIVDPTPSQDPLDNTTHLNLVHETEYNGQQSKSLELQGDVSRANLYVAVFEQDAINRNVEKIIDPPAPKAAGLNLSSKLSLDAANQTVATVDEHGYITRYFYDKCGRERFKVDPENGVSEKKYNTEGDVIYECQYKDKITEPLNDQTTLTQMIDFANQLRSFEDRAVWFFYDENRLESFTLNNLGAVTEKRYDEANRKITDISYATKIDVVQASLMTTAELAALMKSNKNADDRKTNYILSTNIITGKRLEKFTIDPEGYALERIFDDNGNTITETLYAQKIPHLEDIATLSIDNIFEYLKTDDPKNETTFIVYDIRNKPMYRVYPEGNVTFYGYDNNGNLTQECHFGHTLNPVPQDYATLVATLKTEEWVPDKTKGDRITTSVYDANNRLCKVTDPRGNSDEFKLDAVGNILTRTDRNKFEWSYRYDGDNREVSFTTPETTLTLVSYNPELGTTGQLIATEQRVPVTRQKKYNKDNNSITVIEGEGRADCREMTTYYNKCNKPISIEVPNAVVDNPSEKASFKLRPEKTVTLKSQFVYDGKGQLVVSINESGNISFFVYDSMGNRRFVIDGEGCITETQFNSFNEPLQETKYAKALDPVTLKNNYESTGLTLMAMTSLMAEIPDSNNDRTIKSVRDHRGNITLEEQGPIFNYSSNAKQPDTPSYGTSLTQFKKAYNARGKCYLESKLVDFHKKIWATTLYWYDRNGNQVAIVDPDLFVIVDTMNSFNESSEHYEYANALLESPDPTISISALIEKIIQNPDKDRLTKTEYNGNGFAEKITYVNADFQKLVLQDEVYSLLDVRNDLTIYNTYSKTDKLTSVTDEKNNVFYIYYDERDIEIARTGVPRKSQDDQNNDITLVPLTYFGINFAGERVRTRRFKQGTDFPVVGTPPVAKKADIDDQEELIINNSQGNPSFKQDAQKNLWAITYTPTQKEARSWHQLTSWHLAKLKPLKFDMVHPIAEKRSSYDRRNLLLVTTFYKDNALVPDRSTYRMRNSFGDVIAEGPDGINYPVSWEFDLVGHAWKTNAGQGAYHIKLQNAAGQDTLTIFSPHRKLELLTYQDLAVLMTWDIVSAERTQLARSLNGNIVAELLPAYAEPGNMQSLPVPLCMQPVQRENETGTQYLITFPLPQERSYEMKFLIKAHGGPVQSELPIIALNSELCAVDVGQLPTDIYEYEIRYQMSVPGQKEPLLVYQTQGSVQFESSNTTNSRNLVALNASDTNIRLIGKTAELTKPELWQGTQKTADIPYHGETILDLSAYPSGAYTLKPFYNGIAGYASLPFTVYTPVASPTPLSQEIDFSIQLSVEGQIAQVTRQISPSFADKNLRLKCDYIGTDDEPYQQSIMLNPSDNQFTFDHDVKRIEMLSVHLCMQSSQNEQDAIWIPLLIQATPEPQIKAKAARRYQALFPDANGHHTQAKYFERTRVTSAEFFQLLGTTAQHFIETLGNLNPELLAEELAEEIAVALNKGRFISSQNLSWQEVLQQKHNQQAKMNKLIQHLEITLRCDVYHLDSSAIYSLLQNNNQMDLLKEYLQMEMDLALCQTEVMNFCKREIVVTEYIDFLLTHLPGDKSLLLFSKAKNIPLTCWEQSTHNPTQMKMLGKQTKEENLHHFFVYQGQVYALLNEVGKTRLAKPSRAELNEESDWVLVDSKDKGLNDWMDMATGQSTQTVHAVFSPRTILYVTPFASFTEMPTVTFLDMSLDRNAQVANLTPLTLISDTLQSLVLDVSHLPVGLYPYKVGDYQSIFSITRGNPIYPSQSYPTKIDGSVAPLLKEAKLQLIHPIRTFKYDAWRNRIQDQNAIGAVVNKEFNFRNQEKKRIDPPVFCFEEEIIQGKVKYTESTTPKYPTTYNGYDETGCFIGTTNPKGNTSVVVVDAAGQSIEEYLADGTKARFNVFDALGRMSRYQDATQAWWHQYFNHNNLIIKLASPAGRNQLFGYNEINKCISEADANRAYRRNFDVCGFMVEYYEPMGERTVLTKDRNDMVLHISYPDSTSLSYTRNYFGLELTHKDLGGTDYTNAYDLKVQLVTRIGLGGDHGQKLLVIRTSINTGNGTEWHISTFAQAVPNLILMRTYLAGRLVNEQLNDATTSYGHDAEGRLVKRILTITDDTLAQGSRTQQSTLDLQGKEIYTMDSSLHLRPGYDINGNRVYLRSMLTVNNHKWEVRENWNTFSKTDNELISGGKVVNGFVEIDNGYSFTYANGLRQTELHNNITSALGYDADKLLTSISRPDGNITRAFNTSYDLSQIKTGNDEQYDFKYDNNGWSKGQDYSKDTNLVTKVDYLHLTGRGLPKDQQTQNWVQSNSDNNNVRSETLIVDSVDYEYAKFDEPIVKKVFGTRTVNPLKQDDGNRHSPKLKGGTPYQALDAYHNADGSVCAITGQQDETDPNAKYPTMVTFKSTASKSIFSKDIYHNFDSPDGLIYVGEERHFLNPKDQNLGICNAITGNADLNLIRRAVTDHGGVEVGNLSSWRGNETDIFTPMLDPAGPYVEERHLSLKQQMQTLGDNFFHPNRKGDNSSNLSFTAPAIARQTVSVVQNDTTSSLALKMAGTESYANQISQANALVENLYAGYPGLHIPAPLPTKNQAFMYTPYYQFTQKILGALYPHLKTPEMKIHTNPMVFFGKAVIGALAVAAANLVAPVLAEALMPLLFGAMGVTMAASATVVLSGVLAAMADAAGQELLVGLHAQSEISWGEAAMVGVTTAVGNAVNIGFSNVKQLTPLAKEYLRRATLAVTQELSNMEINHTPFNVRAVGLNILLADSTKRLPTDLPISTSLTAPVLNQLVLTGRFDLERTIAQVLGSQVGSYLGQGLGNIINTGIDDLSHYFAPKQEITPSPSYTISSSSRSSNQQKLDDLSSKTNHETGAKRPKFESTSKQKDWSNVGEVFDSWERPSVREFNETIYPKDLELQSEADLMRRWQAAPSRSKERWEQTTSVNSNASVGKIAAAYGEGVVSGGLAPLYAMDYAINNPTALAVGLAINFYNGIHPIQNVQNMIHGIEKSWDHLVRSDSISRAKMLGELSALPLGSGVGASISKLFGSKMALGGLGVAGSTRIRAQVWEAESVGEALLLESPRTQLLRKIEHPGLEKLVKFHYRENAIIGSGSTADILRYELQTGQLYSPSGHMQKALEGRDRLTRLIRSDVLEHQDLAIAKWMRQDLIDALSQDRIFSSTMKTGQ